MPAPIFELLARRGRVDPDEMLATFNMGLGMVLVCERPPAGYPVVGEVVRLRESLGLEWAAAVHAVT